MRLLRRPATRRRAKATFLLVPRFTSPGRTATPEPLPGFSQPVLPVVSSGPASAGGVASTPSVPAGARPVLPGTAGPIPPPGGAGHQP